MEAPSKSQQVTVVYPDQKISVDSRTQNLLVDCLSKQQNVERKISVDGRTQKSLGRLSLEQTKCRAQNLCLMVERHLN